MAINKRLLVKPPSTGITPSEHFGVVLYEGDGTSSNSINGGKFGGAASFNGSSSTIVIPNAIEQPLKGAKEFGVSMWFNLASLPTGNDEDFLISLYQEGYLDIRIKANGVIQGKVAENSSGTDRIVTSANSVIAANTWYHVVWTGKTNDLKLYINGSSIATGSTWNGTFYHSNAGCRIGSKSGPSYYFNGKIDQTRIFQKQLSSSEVTTLYTETVDTVESLTPLGNETIDTLQVLGDTSCIATYQFENNEDDKSDNYNGTGTNIQYAAGRYGQAASFNGTDSVVTGTAQNVGSSFSVSVWIYPTAYGERNIFNLWVDGQNLFQFGLHETTNGKLTLNAKNSNTWYPYHTSSSSIIPSLNQWYHIVVNRSSSDLKIYVNGTFIESANNYYNKIYNTFNIGSGKSTSTNSYFKGKIDQVRVFNKTLSASEVTTLYQESPLIASYRFEGNVNDDMATYHGTPTNVTTEYGLNFTPDFIWAKGRDNTHSHQIVDTSRGITKYLNSNLTNAQNTNSTTKVLSIQDGGFTIGTHSNWNNNNESYVAWCLKANGGTTSSNTDGTNITSTVQVNSDAGFSIVKWTGDGNASSKVGHGLGVKPDMIISKALGETNDWNVNHVGIPDKIVYLHSTMAAFSGGGTNGLFGYYNSNTTTTFEFINGSSSVNNVNKNNIDYIAYCFHSVDGFSKFGSYTGNADNNGPIVETGFEPAFLMIKRTSGTDNWVMIDNRRSPINPKNSFVWANKNDAESTFVGTREVNFYSNGFQPVSDGADDINDNNATYIYMAFAADPDTEAPVLAKSFSTVTYTGNASDDGPVLDIGFNPGFVWLKARETVSNGNKSHRLHDVIRGQQSFLKADSSDAASRSGDRLNFNYSDTQIQITNASKGWNDSGYDYIAWAWKADDNEPTLFGGPAKAIYKFEDNVNDVTGNFNGSASSVTYTSSGKFNKAAVFNGSSSKITLANGSFTFNELTISVWVKPAGSGHRTILENYEYSGGSAGFIFRIDQTTDKARFVIYNGDCNNPYPDDTSCGNVTAAVSTSAIPTNAYTHIVVTMKIGELKMYINGELDVSTATQAIGYNSSAPTNIGVANHQYASGGESYYQGEIDQLRIYNGVASDIDVAALYAETSSNNDDLTLGAPPETIISANANAGFSIVKYIGNGSTNHQIPHGLSSAPEFVIIKNLNDAEDWQVFGSTVFDRLQLNNTGADDENYPLSYSATTITLPQDGQEANNAWNASGDEYIMYSWHSVSGYSAFGYWQGGTTTITIGFRADFVLYQDFGAGGAWTLVDSVRGDDVKLIANTDAAESSTSLLTITDTGFTVTSESSVVKRLYMAFKIN